MLRRMAGLAALIERATVTGTATNTTGAIVVGASVSIRNVATTPALRLGTGSSLTIGMPQFGKVLATPENYSARIAGDVLIRKETTR